MNFKDMIDEVIINVAGYTQRQDQATYLLPINSSNPTVGLTDTPAGAWTPNTLDPYYAFKVQDGTSLSRGTIEIGNELIWVDSFDRVNGIAYISPDGRGFRNSNIAPHASGSRVVISPVYPRIVVQKAINNAITGVYPDLFGVYFTTFPFVAARNTYQMPAEAVDVLSVKWQTVGPTREWLPVRRWKMDKMAAVGTFNTGKTLTVYDGIVPGRTVSVTYSKRPTELSLDSDDFTDSGLPDSAEEVITLGAAYRVSAYLDTPRVTSMSVEADALDQSTPSGAGAQASRYFFAQYKDRLNVEMRRQFELFPTRVHYTR
jgi:hypothetical protein